MEAIAPLLVHASLSPLEGENSLLEVFSSYSTLLAVF